MTDNITILPPDAGVSAIETILNSTRSSFQAATAKIAAATAAATMLIDQARLVSPPSAAPKAAAPPPEDRTTNLADQLEARSSQLANDLQQIAVGNILSVKAAIDEVNRAVAAASLHKLPND